MSQETIDREVEKYLNAESKHKYDTIKKAIIMYRRIGLSGIDLAKSVRSWESNPNKPGIEDSVIDMMEMFDELGTDVCYVAYNDVLQKAKKQIKQVLGIDAFNDLKDCMFVIYGEYSDTRFEYSPNDQELLQDIVNGATLEQIEKLLDSKSVQVFLEDVGITCPNPRE